MNAPASIQHIAGRTVEMTICGEREFTFSFDEVDHVATRKLVDFFTGTATVEVCADDECGTFIYVTA